MWGGEPTCLHPGCALKLPQIHLETMSQGIISRRPWDQVMGSAPSWRHVLSYEPQNTLSRHVPPPPTHEASVVMQDLPGITSAFDCGISCDSRQHEWSHQPVEQWMARLFLMLATFLSDSPHTWGTWMDSALFPPVVQEHLGEVRRETCSSLCPAACCRELFKHCHG